MLSTRIFTLSQTEEWDSEALAEAGHILAQGGLVAFPTETVYGLGADATSPEAIARLYAAKGRPAFNPLIVHVACAAEAFELGYFPVYARRLADHFWPGPLTLVVPVAAESQICASARAHLPSVAIRVPDHPIAQRLIHQAGRPLAAPSANRSGYVSATCTAHVLADLEGRIEGILEGGQTFLGLESTIVDCTHPSPRILRYGALCEQLIRSVLECGQDSSVPENLYSPSNPPTPHNPTAHNILAHRIIEATGLLPGAGGEKSLRPLAPGQLESHYAPHACLRLEVTGLEEGDKESEAILDFGAQLKAYRSFFPLRYLDLSPSGNLEEAAKNLFSALRQLDRQGIKTIAVAHIPVQGIGEALNDRLKRAAAPRTSQK